MPAEIFPGPMRPLWRYCRRKGDRYTIVASEGKLFAPLKKNSIPIDMGLDRVGYQGKKTAWSGREMKPRNHKSAIFLPEDPCGQFRSYIGLPLYFLLRELYGVLNPSGLPGEPLGGRGDPGPAADRPNHYHLHPLPDKRLAEGHRERCCAALWGLFSEDLAMDLGTANTLIYKKNQGIVLQRAFRGGHQ